MLFVNLSKYDIKIVAKQAKPIIFKYSDVIFFTPHNLNPPSIKNRINPNKAG